MTENKRFKYVRDTYRHYVHDTEKDGEWKEGYRGTYGEFDLDKLTIELNKRENRINHLKNENEQLKQEVLELKQMNNQLLSSLKKEIFLPIHPEITQPVLGPVGRCSIEPIEIKKEDVQEVVKKALEGIK